MEFPHRKRSWRPRRPSMCSAPSTIRPSSMGRTRPMTTPAGGHQLGSPGTGLCLWRLRRRPNERPDLLDGRLLHSRHDAGGVDEQQRRLQRRPGPVLRRRQRQRRRKGRRALRLRRRQHHQRPRGRRLGGRRERDTTRPAPPPDPHSDRSALPRRRGLRAFTAKACAPTRPKRLVWRPSSSAWPRSCVGGL